MKWLAYIYNPSDETTTRKVFVVENSTRADARLAYFTATKLFNAHEDDLLVIPAPSNHRG
jgi:hypothetical protein